MFSSKKAPLNKKDFLNRRAFLKRSGKVTAAASATSVVASVTSVAAALTSFDLMAAGADDYKAIVCVYLLGGLDNYDTVLPYDEASYDKYVSLRPSLMARYQGSRDRSKLLPLKPLNDTQHQARSFALPAEMPNLAHMFNQGNAALVANVGPLLASTNATTFEQESVTLPQRLFSHNDQQAAWLSGSMNQARFGWGGAFSDHFIRQGANVSPEFSAITTGDNALFLTGKRSTAFQIDPEGPQYIDALAESRGDRRLNRLLNEHFLASDNELALLAEQDVANAFQQSLVSNRKYNKSVAEFDSVKYLFDEGDLTNQLKVVAQTIAARNRLGVKRQVFIVGIDGFDTHSDQAQDLPQLQTDLDQGVANFYKALEELELTNNVTLFTASEFGRTLSVNDDGTDHGWGGHHFVVGGAVKGQKIYGQIPELGYGHALDAGHGRLIPTLSIEQMAEPIGRWFGLDDAALAEALPSLNRFKKRLTFM